MAKDVARILTGGEAVRIAPTAKTSDMTPRKIVCPRIMSCSPRESAGADTGSSASAGRRGMDATAARNRLIDSAHSAVTKYPTPRRGRTYPAITATGNATIAAPTTRDSQYLIDPSNAMAFTCGAQAPSGATPGSTARCNDEAIAQVDLLILEHMSMLSLPSTCVEIIGQFSQRDR
jgi:hypothetical protein